MEKLIEMLDNDEDIDIIYLVFARASNSVPHRTFVEAMKLRYGVRGQVLQLIRSF